MAVKLQEEAAILQEVRVVRAAREAFSFTPLAEQRWACETETGNCYLVSELTCSCPDWEYRCGPAGTRCKHQVSLATHLLASGAIFAQEAAARAAAVEELRARRARKAKLLRYSQLRGAR